MAYKGGWQERALEKKAAKKKAVSEAVAERAARRTMSLDFDDNIPDPFMSQVDRRRPSQPLYKYVPIKRADGFEGGSIRIGTLKDYRKMEGDRADPHEGTAENRISYKRFDHVARSDRRTRSMLKPMNIDIVDSSDIVVMNVGRRYEAHDHYVFCLTTDPTFKPSEPSRMFRLKSLEQLEATIARIRPDLGPIETSMVTYGDRESEVFATGYLAADPFLKPRRLKWEREARLAWPGTGQESLEPFTLSDPEIGALFELVSRPDLD